MTSNNCVECKSRYDRRRNITHAEDHRARSSEWKRSNPQRAKEARKRWYAENAEKTKANARDFAAQHPHKVRAYKQRSRARRKGADVGEQQPIYAFYSHLLTAEEVSCYWCKEPLTVDQRQIDHIIPLNAGGPHSAGNICVSCGPCNRKKNRSMPEQFAGQSELILI